MIISESEKPQHLYNSGELMPVASTQKGPRRAGPQGNRPPAPKPHPAEPSPVPLHPKEQPKKVPEQGPVTPPVEKPAPVNKEPGETKEKEPELETLLTPEACERLAEHEVYKAFKKGMWEGPGGFLDQTKDDLRPEAEKRTEFEAMCKAGLKDDFVFLIKSGRLDAVGTLPDWRSWIKSEEKKTKEPTTKKVEPNPAGPPKTPEPAPNLPEKFDFSGKWWEDKIFIDPVGGVEWKPISVDGSYGI